MEKDVEKSAGDRRPGEGAVSGGEIGMIERMKTPIFKNKPIISKMEYYH